MSFILKMPQRTFAYVASALLVANCLLCFFAIQRATSINDFFFFHFGVLGLMLCPLLAAYFFLRLRAPDTTPTRGLLMSILLLLSFALLLGASDSNLLRAIVETIHRRFRHSSWQWLGLTLAAAIYLPLIYAVLKKKLRERQFADLAVGGAFLFFVFLLYLPFGFDSIGHWESWVYRAYLEGQHSWNVEYELTTRFWVMAPHLLASVIAPDSFVGFHLVHLLILWGKLALLYGILRKLNFSRLQAFLTTMLFMVYPVNSDLLSLRSLPNQFSVVSLLAAAFLMLEYRESPSRLGLLGVWLGLVFNVVTNETAYAIILVAPLLWVFPTRRDRWRNANLTAIWYLLPACNIAHLLLLSSLNMSFYNSYVFDIAENSIDISIDALGAVTSHLIDIYRHTFIGGWQEAFGAIGGNSWLLPSLAMVAMVGAVSWTVLRASDLERRGDEGQARSSFVHGLLFLLPAVGILILIPQYSGDLWRTYFYVPIGASIVIFSFLRMLTARAGPHRFREAALIGLCLALMLPATARLLLQHESLVIRANSKARMLYQMMEAVPRIKQETVILLTTDMTKEEFATSAISELRYSNDLDNSMLYVLYGNGVPVQSSFCIDERECSTFGGEETIFSSDSPELLRRTLAISIAEDMSVALVEHPAVYFGLESHAPYDINLLFDRNAPLPTRSQTMLK